jgi:anti-sigma regulatory factor (Ser/Thr protein kinase)
VRRLAGAAAERAQLCRARREDLVLAVDELATNSVVHGGGRGELQMWPTRDGILCEVRDGGHICDPLVGARPPRPGQLDGRGLWIAGQLCDRLEIASSPGRTVVRVHVSRR